MQSVIVLGGGMIGSAMAMDLAGDPKLAVTVADARPEVLARLGDRFGMATVEADLSDTAAVKALVKNADVVLGALPSVFGQKTLAVVAECGRRYVDISFMPEDALVHDAVAKRYGAIAVVDCGVAPGISNLMAGYFAAKLDVCERIEILVGGLPQERRWPFDYKAGFAPSDVIEEYTRPSRFVQDGRVVVREALSDPELVDFPGIGTLEAFNTDGLRSLLTTLKAPTMIEKTMRYPGHAALMRVFRETGLFSKDAIDVDGQKVVPLALLSRLLFPKWTFGEGEADLTVLRVSVSGQESGARVTHRFDLLDRYDAKTGLRSMSRTTAFPAVIMARALLRDSFHLAPGVHAPEMLAKKPGLVEHMLAELEARGVMSTLSREP